MNDDVAVVIPFDPAGDPARDKALDFVRAHYDAQDLPVVVASTLWAEPWSKGSAVDRGVRETDPETERILVLADADCLVTPDALQSCLDAVRAGAAWSQPHGPVVRLRRDLTGRYYAGEQLRVRPGRVYGPPGGGIVVLTRTAYETVGGIDPRFVGWGGEDISFARALDTLAGPCARFNEPLVHLWHVPSARRPMNRASPETERLAGRYYDAAGDPAAMRALVDEHRRVRDSTGR